jgi:hypothetical protein
MSEQFRRGRMIVTIVLALAFVRLMPLMTPASATGFPDARPQIFEPFAGDPRLEPIPDYPINLANIETFTTDQDGVTKTLTMRFPPRVNGQVESNGDKHADLYVLFDATTRVRLNQPIILEAVPNGATGPGATVPDLKARNFSAIWEVHAVMVDTRVSSAVITSEAELFSSRAVKEIIQTNIFLNCPIVPNNSTVDPGSAKPEEAFFEGQIVTIVPYDIEDGGFNVQTMFKFEEVVGTVHYTLGRRKDTGAPTRSTVDDPNFIPHLVASHALGDPFYTSIWDVWTVTVPEGTDVSGLKSKDAIVAAGYPIAASGIRLNCPVIMVDGVQVPIEDAFALLTDRFGRFNRTKFPFDIPANQFTKMRNFFITEVNPGAGAVPPPPPEPTVTLSGLATEFPRVEPEGKGNVIPVILTDPLNPTRSSGPNSSGDVLRLDQDALDAAFALNRLPDAFEGNIRFLVDNGLMDAEWLPGGRPYQDRLGMVLGRAYFEHAWLPHQGANSRDVTTCYACHSSPSSGASARGLYSLERAIPASNGGGASRTNPGSAFGAGGAELLVSQMKALGLGGLAANATGSGTQGTTGPMRADVAGAFNTHMGMQSSEFIRGRPSCGLATPNPSCVPDFVKNDATTMLAAAHDLDGDGVTNELTVGEVTAVTAFLTGLPVPNEADKQVRDMLRITSQSVQRGSALFRRSIASGGAGCATCHIPFIPFPGSTTFMLNNPQTNVPLALQMAHHSATAVDVAQGLATYVGQPGLRIYGDFLRHDMGPGLSSPNANPDQRSKMKTAELWSVGSDHPLSRNGGFGSNIRGVIRAHEGEGQASKEAFGYLSPGRQQDIINFLRVQTIQSKVGEGSGAIILETRRLSGRGSNVPVGGRHRASFSMDVKGKPTWGTGWLTYSYARLGMNFVSTGITDVVVTDVMTAVTGTGTVNGAPGYRFTATFLATWGSGQFGMTILRPDGTKHFSSTPRPYGGGVLTATSVN